MTSTASYKTSYLKVRLRYGSGPTDEDFVTWAEDVGTYLASPDMEVKGLHNSGSLEIQPITIESPEGWDIFDNLARGVPYPPIFLFVTEVVTAIGPSGAASEDLLHAIGDYKLARATKNPDRKQGFVRLEFEHVKRVPEKVRLGMASNPGCSWTLGDKSCQLAGGLAALQETATIATIVRKKVTLTNPADAAVVTGQAVGTFPWWYRGYMEIGGLRIQIRDWVDGSYDFQLDHDPPASWAGAVVTLTPGCGKDPVDCVTKFSNIAHFGGFGIKIPAYDPGLELS